MRDRARAARQYAVMSVHPKLADAIIAGRKTVEIRRRAMRFTEGDSVFIYATAPRMQFLGTVRVRGTIADSPLRFWSRTSKKTGLDVRGFYKYVNGASLVHGVFLEQPTVFSRAVSLATVRRLASSFHPPRGHLFLTPEFAARIVAAGSPRPRQRRKLSATSSGKSK